PEKAGHLYGSSYAAIPFFWVPRAVWPDKPESGLGAWVRTTLFRTWADKSGWPPGFIAEAYINFGYFGILVVAFLVGIGLRAFYETFRPLLGVSFIATAAYVALLYRFAAEMVATNVAHGIVTAIFSASPVILILWFAGRLRRSGATGRPTRQTPD